MEHAEARIGLSVRLTSDCMTLPAGSTGELGHAVGNSGIAQDVMWDSYVCRPLYVHPKNRRRMDIVLSGPGSCSSLTEALLPVLEIIKAEERQASNTAFDELHGYQSRRKRRRKDQFAVAERDQLELPFMEL
ncbi:hypothetical protein W02_22450 [Nitrospira sp. KM1]|uniref:hypothetical protein n=1 Tax=Nitrospira sp. KM1 TaxID=1936990 RepID=UPI0013A75453|nr:hypothetical protein [Nitrospira sp. KM1]BCA55105.1 hypothetical protein W02_22450 [Nitrospira sp. KM1]